MLDKLDESDKSNGSSLLSELDRSGVQNQRDVRHFERVSVMNEFPHSKRVDVNPCPFQFESNWKLYYGFFY